MAAGDMRLMRNLLPTTQTLRHVLLPPLTTTRPHFPNYRIIRSQTQLRLNSADSKRSLINGNIGAPVVRVVNAEGGLESPIKLQDALASVGDGNFLQQVSPGTPGEPPICKVFNRQAVNEKAQRIRAHHKETKKRTEAKTLEINWAIDTHDLLVRFKKLKQFLAAGRRVDIILKRKRRGKKQPTEGDINELLEKIKAAIEESNGTQFKPAEGEPGKEYIMHVEPGET